MKYILIRWLLTCLLLGLAYQETGPFTTIILILVTIAIELVTTQIRAITIMINAYLTSKEEQQNQ